MNISNHFLYSGGNIEGVSGSISLHVFMNESDEFKLSENNLHSCGLTAPATLTNGISSINKKLYNICQSSSAYIFFCPAGLVFSASDISDLVEALCADPLYGFAMPRVLDSGAENATEQVVACLPQHEQRVVTGAPVLIKTEVLRDIGLLDEHAVNLDSALAQLFMRANRRGLIARVVNTVQIQASKTWIGHHSLTLSRANDHNKAIAAQSALPELKFERLLSYRFADKLLRHVLFDIRNLAPGFNGTAHHVLSLLEPISRLAAQRGMRPYFWVLEESAKFHGLQELYPGEIIYQLEPNQCFDASIRLTQPWSLTEVRDQAAASTINIFSVLDTIARDCHYIQMPHIESVWRTMAEYADGFVYISQFTRDRFLSRFPDAVNASHAVAHCSMDPAEYWSEDVRCTLSSNEQMESEPYVLIVGNNYYHKGLAEVVPVLSSAFPSVHFKVLGEYHGHLHNVEQISSGTRSEADIARLFADCSCLVFPSFYEGFGLPIFEALAFGKPVLARQSLLIDELRKGIEPVADLISFTTTNDMLRGLKALLEQKDVLRARKYPAVLPLEPYRWENSAADILALVDDLLTRKDLDRCRKRLEFFYRLDMFDIERAGWADAVQNMVSFEFEKEE